jgi:hypothetical protein
VLTLPSWGEAAKVAAIASALAAVAAIGVAVWAALPTGLDSGGKPSRSAYLEQVRQIFPWPQLRGRDTELRKLTRFATARHGQVYAWWQGPAWAGKSALMAWFTLHPPRRVRVVPFFITARYAAQNGREAFLEVMMEQLAELAGQPMPPLATETTRQAWFSRLLQDAARKCAARGERLVLVVDGLDEDQGITVAPGGHSIAAILPAVPPPGVRILVSGRPNPPVPDDVPAGHPLRDDAIVHQLRPSREATATRHDAERELGHLLADTGLGHELLAFSTAAGGGLSASDISELAGTTPGEVFRQLHASSGRTFSSRDSQWQPGTGPTVFLLAHEELQLTAASELGKACLASYRERLHGWAAGYQAKGWPADTPEYLLSGYFRLLYQLGDVTRMVPCATDQRRLDRMLDASGADQAGLIEITTCQDAIGARTSPDLMYLLKLAMTKERLDQRNTSVPVSLPGAWAAIGDVRRAEEMARSIAVDERRDEALAGVVAAVAKAGDLDSAERIAQSIGNRSRRLNAQVEIIEAAGARGERDRARLLTEQTRSLFDVAPRQWPEAPGQLIRADVAAGWLGTAEIAKIAHSRRDANIAWAALVRLQAATDRKQAEDSLVRITDWRIRLAALTELIQAAVAASDTDHARALVARAEATAKPITRLHREPGPHGDGDAEAGTTDGRVGVAPGTPPPVKAATRVKIAATLATLAAAAALAGDRGRARALADQIARVDDRDLSSADRARLKLHLAETTAAAGDHKRAISEADSIPDTEGRLLARVAVIAAVTASGDPITATSLALDVERTARELAGCGPRPQTLRKIAAALAAAGDYPRAEAVTALISYEQLRVETLTEVVMTALTDGGLETGRALIETITSPGRRTELRQRLIRALALAGQLERACEAVPTVGGAHRQAEVLLEIVKIAAQAGETEQADTISQSVTDPFLRTWARFEAMRAALVVRDFGRARKIASSVTDPDARSEMLLRVSIALAADGQPDAAAWPGAASDDPAAMAHDGGSRWSRTHCEVAVYFASAGDHERARRLLDITGLRQTLAAIRTALVAGDFNSAWLTASTLTHPYTIGRDAVYTLVEVIRTAALPEELSLASELAHWQHQDAALAAVSEAALDLGDLEQAETTAHDISDLDLFPATRTRLAAALAANGDWTRAMAIAATHGHARRVHPASVLEIVRAAVTAGDADRANTIALGLPPGEQARARVLIAEIAAPVTARPVLASLLRQEPYDRSLMALGKADPAALVEATKSLGCTEPLISPQ